MNKNPQLQITTLEGQARLHNFESVAEFMDLITSIKPDTPYYASFTIMVDGAERQRLSPTRLAESQEYFAKAVTAAEKALNSASATYAAKQRWAHMGSEGRREALRPALEQRLKNSKKGINHD